VTEGPAPWLGGLLLVSLLFMLNAHLFFTLNTGMDLYGFYTMDRVAAYPMPAVLSTLLNIALAVAAYLFYGWLYRHQAWFSGGWRGPFTRGAVLSAAPVVLAYAPSILLTSVGGKPTLIAVAGLMSGSLCVTHALTDSEARLDPTLARYLFIGSVAAILVFLVLSVAAMLALYSAEWPTPTDNFLWKWDFEWSDMGYPREEFQQRQREALVGFTITGAGFMIVALGGSMLGAILRWTREPQSIDPRPTRNEHRHAAPSWAAQVVRRLESLGPLPPGESEYLAILNGHEIGITRDQYLALTIDKDDFIREVDLLVDKSLGNAQLRDGRTWQNLHFRAGTTRAARRSGPFALLCIYARYPGRTFSISQLRAMLDAELPNHFSINISDFINQLRAKKPALPIHKGHGGTHLSEAIKICLLQRRRKSPRPPPKP